MIYKNEDITKPKLNNRNPLKEILKLVLFAIIIVIVYTLSLVLMSLKTKEQTYIFGLKAYVVDTDSMEPALSKGDLIIIRKCTYNDLKKGLIITFKNRGELITHRIVSINEGNGKIVTKGDKNKLEDIEPVRFDDIEGIFMFKMPKFEYMEFHLKHGIYWALILMTITTLVLHNKRISRKKNVRRKKKKIEDKKNKAINN